MMSEVDPESLDPAGDAARRRARSIVVIAVGVAVLVALLVWLTLSSSHNAGRADTEHAAASKACGQVERLGQVCATAPGESVGAAAIVPSVGPVSPLPGRPSRSATVSPGPEDATGQANAPGDDPPPYTNPDPAIVGLSVRTGRLIVTYADGTEVDAGRVVGGPPAIVVALPIPSPAGDPSSSAVPDETTPAASPAPSDEPASPAETGTP